MRFKTFDLICCSLLLGHTVVLQTVDRDKLWSFNNWYNWFRTSKNSVSWIILISHPQTTEWDSSFSMSAF